ncbi:hypothetical protein [Streptomyces orinoci]|uniref:DUF7848 domain-containing protein n=1 Tax=Streptomyces orinoci TaxID=67339 RepID=A0ABV3K6W7_STRON|nr:hypothetical protein [Streptomyces orinoci]
MGTTTRYRFRDYTVRAEADPLTLPTFTAVCVTGDERDCGATSGDVHSPDELVRWIAAHCAQTRHGLYERTTRETVCAEPGAWR